MTVYWTGGGPGLQAPNAFIEIAGANPPARPPVGTTVRVRNAETLQEITSFFGPSGTPVSSVTTLANGYLIFGVEGVKAVDISADNWTTVTRLVMTNAVLEILAGTGDAADDAAAVRYGPPAQRPIRAALAGRLESRGKIVVAGDSNGEGQGASPNSRRWVSRLQQSLRNAYGLAGGGIGYLPAYTDSFTLTQPATVDTSPSGSAANKDTRFGLGGRSYQLIRGAALVYSQVCTSFVVHYAKDTYGTLLKVIVDGTQIATIDTNGASSGGYTWTSPQMASGTHQVRLENGDPTVGYGTTVSGVDFRNGDETSGITVYDASHYGWNASDFTSEHDKSLTAIDPDCIVHALGANDAVLNTAFEFRTNMQARIARAEAAVTKPHTVVLLAHVARSDTTKEPWANYVTVLAELADSMPNAVLLDLGRRMPTIAADSLGLFDGTVHFTNRGHALVEDVVFSELVPSGGAGGGSAAGGGGGGAVASVNGQTGIVSLDAAAVGAASATHGHNASQITGGTLPVDRAPAGTVVSVIKPAGGSWPARPTTRTDVVCMWIGADPSPPIVASGTAGMYASDIRFLT